MVILSPGQKDTMVIVFDDDSQCKVHRLMNEILKKKKRQLLSESGIV